MYLRQIYKEHLKQDTLEEEDEAVAPRVFRGMKSIRLVERKFEYLSFFHIITL